MSTPRDPVAGRGSHAPLTDAELGERLYNAEADARDLLDHVARLAGDLRSAGRAIASVLDVVEELAQGLAWRQRPGQDWAQVVADTFAMHRRELRGEDVEWPAEPGSVMPDPDEDD